MDHCGIARSILRLSSSKNEGGRVCLCQCQNPVAFTLPATLPPVERTLATTVVLGVSFCCLTSTEARRPIRDGDERERETEE